MINKKGIFSFLIITFGITYLIEGILILSGFRVTQIPAMGGQLVIAMVMWAPAAATLVTARFITHEKLVSTGLRFGKSWKPYLATALLIPPCFLITYLLTWMLGLGSPDWGLQEFFALIASSGADMSGAPSPTLLLGALLASSIFIAPFINSIFGLGEEWGWRGYLLPRLLPLGKRRATLLVGLIWGLWHAPLVLIGFNYPGYPLAGILFMVLLTTAISVGMNELSTRYDSAILAGWMHGAFNSQAYGIWRPLFPGVNPLLGGMTGLVGIAVFSLAGYLTVKWCERESASAVR